MSSQVRISPALVLLVEAAFLNYSVLHQWATVPCSLHIVINLCETHSSNGIMLTATETG